MSNPHKIPGQYLDEIGGEALEGSGFELDIPERQYSDEYAAVGSANDKEPNDVQ
jgi:hypothetical protein